MRSIFIGGPIETLSFIEFWVWKGILDFKTCCDGWTGRTDGTGGIATKSVL